jgi:ribosomal protein S12 methylthiotransferase
VEDLLPEAELLRREGAQEIVLAAQDTASFGLDRGKPELPLLLDRLADRIEVPWLRLAYADPDNLSFDTAEVMARHMRICDYIDFPIQHAAPGILKAMGRRADPGRLSDLISGFRSRVKGLALRTSVMVGFPGESEADFQELLAFLAEVKFDMAGVFAFSPQPGTPAAAMGDRIPHDLKQERLVEVVALQEEIARNRMEQLVGREVEMLIEESGEGISTGRTSLDMAEVDRTVRVEGSTARPGSLIRVRLTGVRDAHEWCARHL